MTNKILGRPLITTKDFPVHHKEHILNIMSEGASLFEVYAYLDISDKTFARIMRDDYIFFRTIKKGVKLSRAWWEKKGRSNLENKDFSPVLWYMNMRNRFGWADKKEIDHTTKGRALPRPILGGLSVQKDDSTRQDSGANKKD